jgi:hypothetical protein
MSVILENVHAPQSGHLEIEIKLTADVRVSSFVAKQKVNYFLATEVGNLLHAGEPALTVADKIYWRVPVLFSLPSAGQLGQVGQVDVDVETGEVKTEPALVERISHNATQLANTPL